MSRNSAPYDVFEAKLIAAGAEKMAHDCGDTDVACNCAEPHAAGDVRCAQRHLHSPCRHDLALLRPTRPADRGAIRAMKRNTSCRRGS